MSHKSIFAIVSVLGMLLLGTGCASRAPTIAHVHIGHAIDGWETTPEQTGWLETAEKLAQTSLQAAQRAARTDAPMESRKKDVEILVQASHPEFLREEMNMDVNDLPADEIGVRSALFQATRHIEFAAESDDASANVKAEAKKFATNSQAVFDRCDLIAAMGVDALIVQTDKEVDLLTKELLNLARANIHGEDLNHDGVIGGQNSEEYGLEQLRGEIQNMIDREDPPYSTVERWYLFNLIRLPSGKWVFRQNASGKKGGSY